MFKLPIPEEAPYMVIGKAALDRSLVGPTPKCEIHISGSALEFCRDMSSTIGT